MNYRKSKKKNTRSNPRRQQRMSELQKDTRMQRMSRTMDSTLAIETVSKIVDLIKPWELNPANRFQTYQLMMLDADIVACVSERIKGIETAQANSKFIYDENSERSVFLKNYLDHCVYRMKGSLRAFGSDAGEMVYNGLAPFEIVTDVDIDHPEFTGTFVLDALSYIDPLTIDMTKPFETKNSGREITHINQRLNSFRDTTGLLESGVFGITGRKPIDFRKVAIATYSGSSSRPFGRSPFDATYTPWREKGLIQEYLLMGIQKDLAGTPVLRVPLQLFEEAKDPNSAAARTMEQLQIQMSNLHAGDQTFMILPSDTFSENGSGTQMYGAQFLGVEGSGKAFDLVAILEQKKKTIYTVMGCSHLITGENGGGSYNLQEGKANIAAHYNERDNLIIDEIWNEKVIPLLFKLNGWKEKLSDIPVYKHGQVQPVSLDEWGKGFQRVQRALPMTPKVVNAVLKRLEIPYQVDENTSQEELKELLLLAGLQNNSGAGEGSSGTGDTQSGGASSDNNSENAA